MIVKATLDANWRSSLTITPKEVDTFSSNCENSGHALFDCVDCVECAVIAHSFCQRACAVPGTA